MAAVGMLLVSTDSLWVRLSKVDALDAAFLVAVLSLPAYTILGLRLDRLSPSKSLRTHPRALLLVGVLACTSQLSFITAITRTTVANVVAIVATAPVLAAACAWLVLGERPSRRVSTAIVITLVGIGVIVSSSIGKPTLDGDLFALLAVVCFAVNMTLWRRHPDMSRFIGLSISSLLTVACTSFAASPFSLDARAYLAIGAMGLCFNPLGRLAHTNAPRFAPVSEVALFAPVETVAGTIWAWLFLSETPTSTTLTGAAVVIFGIVYGTLGTNRSAPAAP